MGPFQFVKYRGTRGVFATVHNIYNGNPISVTSSHLIPFDSEISPALIS